LSNITILKGVRTPGANIHNGERKVDRLKQEEFIEEVKAGNEITSVIGEYVSLRKRGSSFLGLCPFHQEKTPSFNVNPEKQFFYCFGCGTGGDVINFIMRMENLTFPEALNWLAERAGISLPVKETPAEQRAQKEREWLFRLHKLAALYYRKILTETPAGNKARAYLEERGITPAAAEEFLLGYAPDSWTGLVDLFQKKNLSLQAAEKSGLILRGEKGYYDRFRDRLLFPISNPQGRVAAFGGRLLGEGVPKYLNSPETPLFSKGRYLYGLFQAKEAIRREGRAVVVEGYMDLLQAHQAGFKNVVAALGTALTRDQARALRRYTEYAVIAFDADLAGQAAAMRGLDILKENGLQVQVVTLPPGEDPDSLLRKEGPGAFRQLLEASKDLFTFKLDYFLEKAKPGTPEKKAQVVKAILPLLAEEENMVVREEYIRRVAVRLEVSEEAVYTEWRKYARAQRKKKQPLDIKRKSRNTNDITHPAGLPPAAPGKTERETPSHPEREVLRLCLQEKKNLERIKEALSGIDWTVEEYRLFFIRLLEVYTAESWPPPASLFPAELRSLYTELQAENELGLLPPDLDGCCRRLRQLQLSREIRQIQQEVAAAAEDSPELHEKLALLNKLHRQMREEFPSFSGLR
jgi:DNA primase